MNKRSSILASMTATEAPAKSVSHTLSAAVYKKLEEQFPIQGRAVSDIEAAIQLGQQQVLRALRVGIVVAA